MLSDAAEKIGFRTIGAKLSLEKLEEVPLPCVLHWNKSHYTVLYKISSSKLRIKKNQKKHIYYISDPAIGLIEYSTEEFLKFWIGNNANENTCLLYTSPSPRDGLLSRMPSSA